MDTTVLEEKKYNPRLTKTKEEFVKIMANLNLAYPDQIGISIHIFLKIILNNSFTLFFKYRPSVACKQSLWTVQSST